MNKLNKYTLSTAISLIAAFPAFGDEIATNTAVMQAMDKITGQVDLIEVPVNQEVTFGTFSILVRECKTRSPEETPENFAFVDVVDNTISHGSINIFKGWMLSSSPALNPIAHPIYDVWLIKCIDRKTDTSKRLSDKELAARDEIEMNRQVIPEPKISPEQPSTIDNNGEPTALIPADIETQNSDADKEAVSGQINDIPTQIDSNYEIPEEGEPEALINFPDEQPINPQITQPADYETIENISTISTQPAEHQTEETQQDVISKLESELSAKVNN